MHTVYLCVLIYRSQRNIKRLMWGNLLQLPPLVTGCDYCAAGVGVIYLAYIPPDLDNR